MAWYEISLDELQHNEEMHKEMVTDPRQKSIKLIEMMLARVLQQLGVDTSLEDEDIKAQQRLMGIDIKEMDEKQLRYLCYLSQHDFNPKALGFYIYQHSQPIAFISDPYVQQGAVKVAIEPYDTRIRFDETTMLLARG